MRNEISGVAEKSCQKQNKRKHIAKGKGNIYEQGKKSLCRKKPAFAVKAKELQAEIKSYLGISSVTGVRELIRYDIENISEETYKKALVTVFQSRR